MTCPATAVTPYELRYEPRVQPGRALSFPCDECGRVTLDDLSERARSSYLYARVVVGHEFATPAVVPRPATPDPITAAALR